MQARLERMPDAMGVIRSNSGYPGQPGQAWYKLDAFWMGAYSSVKYDFEQRRVLTNIPQRILAPDLRLQSWLVTGD